MNAIPLFGPVTIDISVFAAMKPHVQTEAALLLRERALETAKAMSALACETVNSIEAEHPGQVQERMFERHAYRLPGQEAGADQLDGGRAYSEAAERDVLTKGAGRVLAWLCRQPEMCAQTFLDEMASAIGIPNGTMRHALQRLNALDYIELSTRGRGYRKAGYRVTPLGLKAAVAAGLHGEGMPA